MSQETAPYSLQLVREIVFPNLGCHKVEHRDYKIPMQQKEYKIQESE